MKLRILGNSIRLRVSQEELSRLSKHGHTSDEIVFGAGSRLSYELKINPGGESLEACCSATRITVSLPGELAATWTGTDQVSLRGEQAIPGGGLKILVEKDFQCLEPRPDEDEAGLFPNPNATA